MKVKTGIVVFKIVRFIVNLLKYPFAWISMLFIWLARKIQGFIDWFGHWLLTKTDVYKRRENVVNGVDLSSPYLNIVAYDSAVKNGLILWK